MGKYAHDSGRQVEAFRIKAISHAHRFVTYEAEGHETKFFGLVPESLSLEDWVVVDDSGYWSFWPSDSFEDQFSPSE